MVRRISFLSLLFSMVILLSLASAENLCSNENQIILKLSAESNAHGAIFSGNQAYKNEICYNQIYGVNYEGDNPHDCNGEDTNLVLKLSAESNAHGERKSGTNYNVPVCYGDLVCRMSSLGGDCQGNEREIVQLSAESNAHLAFPDTDFYDYKICCVSPSTLDPNFEITRAYWLDAFGDQEILETNRERIVKMAISTTGISEGTSVEYELYKKKLLNDESKGVFSAEVDSAGNAYIDILISEYEIDGEDSTIYFVARVNGLEKKSEELKVLQEPGINTVPRIMLNNPLNREIYFKDKEIQFSAECLDDESPANIGWEIIQENNGFSEGFSENNFNLIFDKEGQVDVTIRCIDTINPEIDSEKKISILVIDSNPNILAYINKPIHRQIIQNNEYKVEYDASESYVVKKELDVIGECGISIVCLAGNCPERTSNSPNLCSSEDLSIDMETIGFGNLLFSWNFHDGELISDLGLVAGERYYGDAGEKTISLEIDYEDMASGNAYREFILTPTTGCIKDENSAMIVIVNENTGEIEEQKNAMNSYSVCSNDIGGGNCCPYGYVCSEEGNGCVQRDDSPKKCIDYLEEEACNLDELGLIAIDPLAESLNCGEVDSSGNVIQCECYWSYIDELDIESCTVKESYIKNSPPAAPGNACTPDKASSCAWAPPAESCENNDGIIQVDVLAEFVQGTCDIGLSAEDYGCFDKSITLDCRSKEVKLSFFGYIHLFGSIMAIAIIYLFIFGNKRE